MTTRLAYLHILHILYLLNYSLSFVLVNVCLASRFFKRNRIIVDNEWPVFSFIQQNSSAFLRQFRMETNQSYVGRVELREKLVKFQSVKQKNCSKNNNMGIKWLVVYWHWTWDEDNVTKWMRLVDIKFFYWNLLIPLSSYENVSDFFKRRKAYRHRICDVLF